MYLMKTSSSKQPDEISNTRNTVVNILVTVGLVELDALRCVQGQPALSLDIKDEYIDGNDDALTPIGSVAEYS